METNFKELVAASCHEQWSGWMKYLFSLSLPMPDGSIIVPPDLVVKWRRQMQTEYENLTEAEKISDRTQADKFIHLIWLQSDHK